MALKPKGIIPAMVTPFLENEELDEEGVRTLVHFLIKNRVHGIFVSGSQGEFWALSKEEKGRLFALALDEAGGKVPIYAGVGAESTRETIELAAMAKDIGIDAVTVLTPYYIQPNDIELFKHYGSIASKIDLPIVFYNNPSRTGGVDISQRVLTNLIREYSNIVGVKDSSGNIATTYEYIQHCGDRISILVGRDTLILASLQYGAHGAIAACANVIPDLIVEIYESFQKGDHVRAMKAQRKVSMLRGAFNLGSFPSVVKEAMTMMKLPAGPCRMPILSLSHENHEKLRQIMSSLGARVF